jgi:2-polyprenyl-3-methyl-5-hydroxy-6-metoxy-1,4-benzoquinol methylase
MDKMYWEKVSRNYNSEIFDVLKNDRDGVIKAAVAELASGKKNAADIGCAVGKWLPMLSAGFKNVVAIDFSSTALKVAEAKFKNVKNIQFYNFDISEPFLEGQRFDFVLCINTVITDIDTKRERIFRELTAKVNKGGHMVLVVPSVESALYSEFALDFCNKKAGVAEKKANGTISQKKHEEHKKGIIPLSGIPTKHYLREELTMVLAQLGFAVEKMEKVQYSWNTEMKNPPRWLKTPYPWDWMVVAKKVS